MNPTKLEIQHFNKVVPIRKLLKEFGACGDSETSIYCPFHLDRAGGHKSGAVRDDINLFKCYSEQKVYTPYDVLTKLLKKSIGDYIDPDKTQPVQQIKKSRPPIPDYIFKLVSTRKITLSQAAEKLRSV